MYVNNMAFFKKVSDLLKKRLVIISCPGALVLGNYYKYYFRCYMLSWKGHLKRLGFYIRTFIRLVFLLSDIVRELSVFLNGDIVLRFKFVLVKCNVLILISC